MTDSNPTILLLGEITHPRSLKAWSLLSHKANIITPHSTNRTDFIKECASPRFSSVLAAYRTFASISITGPFDADLVSALPKSLRYLAHCGAGYDQISIPACSAREPPLLVSNVTEAADDSTADVTVFLLLGALRNFYAGAARLRKGGWVSEDLRLGNDPQGKVLGILGMGGIGRAVARRVRPFGMSVIYHNRRRLKEEDGTEYVGFDELLAKSDVLSVNLPLNPATRHIISTPEFQRMKPGVVIINTARGPVMDEAALVDALNEGRVSSVGLDVFENEPEVHPGLLDREEVLLLPHMGTWCVETQEKMELAAIGNLESVVAGEGLRTMVPEQRAAGLGP